MMASLSAASLSTQMQALRLGGGQSQSSLETHEQTDSGIVDDNKEDKDEGQSSSALSKPKASTAVGDASASGDTGFVDDLLADENVVPEETRVEQPCSSMYKEDVQPKIAAMFEQDADGENDLMIALTHPDSVYHQKVVAFLIDNADSNLLNLQSKFGMTALTVAVFYQNLSAIRRLRLAGANANVQDYLGNSAVHYAAFYGHRDALLKLTTKITDSERLAYRSAISREEVLPDVNTRNCDGKTALHIATERRNVKVIQVLNNMNADPNITENSAGRTALHIAVELGYFDCVAELTKFSNVDVNARNYAGRTPLDCTLNLDLGSRDPIVKLLEECQAEYHYHDSDMDDCEYM